MEKKIIVLVTSGKCNGSADNMGVKLFTDSEEALSYCDSITELDRKYWVSADIVDEGIAYEADNEGLGISFAQDFMTGN